MSTSCLQCKSYQCGCPEWTERTAMGNEVRKTVDKNGSAGSSCSPLSFLWTRDFIYNHFGGTSQMCNMCKRKLLGFPPKSVSPTNSLMLQTTDLATQVKKPLCLFWGSSLSHPHIGSFSNICWLCLQNMSIIWLFLTTLYYHPRPSNFHVLSGLLQMLANCFLFFRICPLHLFSTEWWSF